MNANRFREAVMLMQMEFVEMPELRLSLSNAARFWAMPADLCKAALDVLVDVGFLAQSADGVYGRRGTPPVRMDVLDPLTRSVRQNP